jgi:hypothetical protein
MITSMDIMITYMINSMNSVNNRINGKLKKIIIRKHVSNIGSDPFANCVALNPVNKDPKTPSFVRELEPDPVGNSIQPPLTRHDFCNHVARGGIYFTIVIPNIVNLD